MTQWFHVGQKVVCIDATGHSNIAEGAVYTIEHLARCDGCLRCWEPHVVLELEGIDNPHSPTNGFDAKRFRALLEKKTDISVFKALLNATKAPANA